MLLRNVNHVIRTEHKKSAAHTIRETLDELQFFRNVHHQNGDIKHIHCKRQKNNNILIAALEHDTNIVRLEV